MSSTLVNEPLVSGIIPTYNRPEMLRTAIESALMQTYSNIELIVVDDSREGDSNQSVVEALSRSDARVIYTRNTTHPHGIAGARNAGLDLAKGKYIAFLDDDDRWYPVHVSECVSALERHHDIDWIFSLTDVYKGESYSHTMNFDRAFKQYAVSHRDGVHRLEGANILADSIRRPVSILVGCSVFRRDVFSQVRFDETLGYMDDVMFKFEAISRGFRLAYVNSVHLRYLIHDKNASNVNPEKPIAERFKASEDVARCLERIVARIQIDPATRRIFEIEIGKIYFWSLGYEHYRNNDHKNAYQFFRKGIATDPLNFSYWKTFLLRGILRLPLS